MARLKTKVIFIMFLLEQSIQIATSSENSEIGSDQTGYVSSIQHCFNKKPKMLAQCMLKHVVLTVEHALASNDTWHLNEYVSLKKNPDWKPVEIEAREYQNVFSVILKKLSDLLMSRSLQFSIPESKQQQPYQNGEARSVYSEHISNLADVQFGGGSYVKEEGAKQNNCNASDCIEYLQICVILRTQEEQEQRRHGI